VDGGKVGVLELYRVSLGFSLHEDPTHQGNEVSLGCLLKSHDGRRLETEVGLEVLSNLTDQTLEGKLADQELGRPVWSVRSLDRCKAGHSLLVTTDLTESDGSGPVPVGLLDTSGSLGSLPGGLGSQLLAGSLSSGRFTGGLLGTGWNESAGIHRDSATLMVAEMRRRRLTHCE
jgi:hypothetical protein